MEATLGFEMLRDTSVSETVDEESIKELDDILDEVVNLAENIVGQKPVLDNMIADGEKAVDEIDFAMQTGDYLELEKKPFHSLDEVQE